MKHREILFRGKCSEGWSYGDLTNSISRKNGVEHKAVHIGTDWDFEIVVPETVGQFIGSKDKDNILIFEGDILKDTEDNIAVVLWIKEWGMFGNLFFDEFEAYKNGELPDESMFWTFPIDGSVVEVIGNIHDNPELLSEYKNFVS